jgi:hypothetical protein
LPISTDDVAARITAYLQLCRDLGSGSSPGRRRRRQISRVISSDDQFVRLGAEESAAMVVSRERYERYTGELLARVGSHHAATSAPESSERFARRRPRGRATVV